VNLAWFLDRQLGFIGTNLGFYQTTDGGRSWSPYPVGAEAEHRWGPYVATGIGLLADLPWALVETPLSYHV